MNIECGMIPQINYLGLIYLRLNIMDLLNGSYSLYRLNIFKKLLLTC